MEVNAQSRHIVILRRGQFCMYYLSSHLFLTKPRHDIQIGLTFLMTRIFQS